MKLNSSDIIIIAIYFLFILYLGFYIARRGKNKLKDNEESAVDFLLAGRKLTLPMFVGTLVATWYGNILGMGEFVYLSGISAWVCFALPYYIAALLFAVFLAKRIRSTSLKTIPEQVFSKFGAKAAWLSALIVLIITMPAAYYLMLGTMLKMFLGIELWLAIALGALLSLAYLFTGGFKADVITNGAQFALMYIGFGLLFFYCLVKFGSIPAMFDALPARHKDFSGGLPWQYILAWFIISFQTFVDPGFHQRCAAAKTPQTAQRGILVSILFWIVFDFLTLITGLYAAAYVMPETPVMSYPALGELVLPPIWKGVFVSALLAVIMSTLVSYSFISATTIGNDILNPIIKKYFSLNIGMESLTRAGLVITGLASVALAVVLPSAIELIYKTASIAVPGLLAPLLASYSKKYFLTGVRAIVLMLVPASASGLWTLFAYLNTLGILNDYSFFLNYEPMLVGISVSIFFSLILVRKRSSNGI